MNEFSIIKKYFLPLSKGKKEAGNFLDDAAIININNQKDLIISKDLMAEDIHFNISDGAYNIAKKLLKSNLSDLAACGSKPLYYMLGFSQNKLDKNFIQKFCQGLKDAGEEFNIALIGGDSIKIVNKLCFSITIFGETIKGKSLKRNASKAEDLVFVSGNIGDAFLGLNLLQKKIVCSNKKYHKYLIKQHLEPQPQIKLGLSLVKNNLSQAAIDISDGFLADLLHICQASNLDCLINLPRVPFSLAAKFCLKQNQGIDSSQLLSGGEDYQLIFTSKPENEKNIANLAKKIGVKITCVGKMQKTQTIPKIKILDQKNQEFSIKKYGYLHY